MWTRSRNAGQCNRRFQSGRINRHQRTRAIPLRCCHNNIHLCSVIFGAGFGQGGRCIEDLFCAHQRDDAMRTKYNAPQKASSSWRICTELCQLKNFHEKNPHTLLLWIVGTKATTAPCTEPPRCSPPNKRPLLCGAAVQFWNLPWAQRHSGPSRT
jgi:hypothetical protein